MSGFDSAPAGRQLAAIAGPERIAFVLSIIVVIGIALAIGVGPFRPGGAAPSETGSPAPSGTGAARAMHARTSLSRSSHAWLDELSVPGRPAGPEA